MIGIWRHVTVSQYPAVHPRANMVLLVRGLRTEIGDHQLGVRLHAPDGDILLDHSARLQLMEPPAGVQEVEAPGIIVIDLPLKSPGEHVIAVTLDGREAARLPFMAGNAPMAPPATGEEWRGVLH